MPTTVGSNQTINMVNLAFNNSTSGLDGTTTDEPASNTGGGGVPREPSTQAIIICAILSVFCVLGIVGNALAFLIYYRKRDKGTSTIFILSLAVTDFLTCLIMIPYTIATELLIYKHTYELVCKLYLLLQTMVIPLSSLIMVAIGIDRYFCICHPFMRAVTVPRAKIILVVLTLVSLALGIVPALGHSVYYLEDPKPVIVQVNRSDGLEETDSVTSSILSSANLSSWVASLSDAILPTAPNGGHFSYGPSPPPNYISASTSASSTSTGGDGTTPSPDGFFTNGLFLEPDQDFLDSFNNQGPQTVPASPSAASVLQSAALSTASALSSFFSSNTSNSGLGNSSQSNSSTFTSIRMERKVIYYGYCYRSEVTLTIKFVDVYQKFYAGLYLVEFVILALLYVLIYRSILVRRAWKAKRKRMSCYASAVNGPEETQLTQINTHVNVTGGGSGDAPGVNGAGANAQPTAETGLLNPKKNEAPAGRVSAAMRDRAFYANIRTAAMLFVVTVGFVVSFLPSWLMGLRVMRFNMIVFYMFYINNVINPFIYAFMNRTFRDDLVQLIKGCLRR